MPPEFTLSATLQECTTLCTVDADTESPPSTDTSPSATLLTSELAVVTDTLELTFKSDTSEDATVQAAVSELTLLDATSLSDTSEDATAPAAVSEESMPLECTTECTDVLESDVLPSEEFAFPSEDQQSEDALESRESVSSDAFALSASADAVVPERSESPEESESLEESEDPEESEESALPDV